MINIEPIKPLLKEDYISPHLEEEQRKREIPLMPQEELHWWEKAWLWSVEQVTKFLRKYG